MKNKIYFHEIVMLLGCLGLQFLSHDEVAKAIYFACSFFALGPFLKRIAP